MNTLKRILCLALSWTLILSLSANAEIFLLPSSVKRLESQALSGMPMPDGILINENLTYIAPDAFDDTTVYGISGGKAQQYAEGRNLEFVPIDISDITIDVPAFASPYRPFEVSVSSSSLLPLPVTATVGLYKEGVLYAEAETDAEGKCEIILFEGGLYDYQITATNGYASATSFFDGETEIYEPVRLISERFFMRKGESIRPVDETEERSVVLKCESPGLSISGDIITANELGKYTVTAETEYMGDTVYTDFEVNVVIAAEALLTSAAYVELYPGDTFLPEITVQPDEAALAELVYASSNPEVACVDETGLITAISQGTAEITVSAFDAQATIEVRVRIAAESIHILPWEGGAQVTEGGSLKLNYEVLPENADDVDVVWRSTDESVLTVDAAGYVHGVSKGSARIFATAAANNEVYDAIVVTVLRDDASISADVPERMFAGDSAALNVQVTPNGEYTFDISDETVISLDENGTLTALGAGTATLTLTSAGGRSAAYRVRVYEHVNAISFVRDEIYLNAGMTASASALAALEPAGCLVENVSFESGNEEVFTVNRNGEITAAATGTALLTMTADGVSASLTVNVVSDGSVISAVAVSSTYLPLNVGASATLSPVITGGQGIYKTGSWYSDAPETVEITAVSTKGVATIHAKAPGYARIYMVSSSGQTAYCEVMVNPLAARSIALNQKLYTLLPGEMAFAGYTLSPAGANADAVYMYTSNPAVATVDGDGLITAVSAGECELFVYTGGLASSGRIIVSGIDMQAAQLCESEYRGNAGDRAEICYTYEPQNASPASFTWNSEDTDVAEVDPYSGIVFYKHAGETLIHGVATDASGIELTLSVFVEEVPVKSLSLAETELTLKAGESAPILYSVYPHNASYAEAVFESVDENIATVDESGMVKAIREGSTEIYVSVGSGEYELTKTVSVTVERTTETVYRAFVMGQFTVPGSRGYLPFSLNSTRGVFDALGVSTIDGASYSVKYLPANPSVESIRSSISGIANLADEDDVTVIFLLSHGTYSEAKGYYMQFPNGSEYKANTIIGDVTQISGHVVLVVCSCHSGRILQCSALGTIRANGGAYTGRNGEGHLSVICSSTDTKSTYYNVTDTTQAYDFYTKAFTAALGWDMISDSQASIKADADGDGRVSIGELSAWAKVKTQTYISSYIQLHGTNLFYGDQNQYPSSYIPESEAELAIFGR